ncbi:MAG: hypothetical protein J6J29_05985 [Paludibacteraceae bacterium]|nr:hypothetical protein [Paludibacteraceae bacterium]
MAKVVPSLPFDNFSGKLSSKQRLVMRTRNGRVHSYEICNPYMGPLAESRKRTISTFSQAVTLCKQEMSDTEKLAYWNERYAQYRKDAQRNPTRANAKFIGTVSNLSQKPNDKVYSTLRGFIIASLSAQLKATKQ